MAILTRASVTVETRPRINWWARNPRLILGLSFVVPLALVAILGPMLNIGDPFKTNALNSLAGPGQGGLLGTDENGRDLLVRIVYGLRTSLFVAITSTLIGAFVGTLAGLSAGYFRGWVEQVLMRLVDVILVFPAILVAIAIVSFIGGSITNLIIVLSLLVAPNFGRIIHASTLAEGQRDYVEAAHSIGARERRILFKHILPNVSTPLFTELALMLGRVVLIESSLSFVGLGAPPPEPTLGIMVSTARGYLYNQPWMLIWPSLVLAILVVGFNLSVDGLRDWLDPRLKR
ncbi:MAG: ABC transporter permease [Chloroflexi bacterium]|nr:ABC transporter permease [Chloroflexota bacterium]